MKQYSFELHYQKSWGEFDKILSYLEKSKRARKKIPGINTDNFPVQYQSLCQQLALAEERGYSQQLVQRLQQLVNRGHQLLYQRHSHFGQALLNFVLRTFPETIRKEYKIVLSVHFIFYFTVALTMMISHYFPDFIYLFISEENVDQFEEMYTISEGSRRVGPRDSDQNWMMFAHYIYNNITVAFRTFASGLIFCIGSLFYVTFNAIYFGLIGAHLNDVGLGGNFWPFVIGHGSFELTAILIAGAAGVKLGLSVLIPRQKTRMESLYAASQSAVNLILGALLFLIIAAVIEAYWSSMHETLGVRYIVGGILWLLVFSYLFLTGRNRTDED